jgi:menaquinone-dependent protoporphyrinogen oxidase
MKSVLIVYGTTEGQTRKIAEFIADAMKERGVVVELVDSASVRAALVQPVHAAVVVCGSLHQNRYRASLQRFVKENVAWLVSVPAALVTVSLTAARNDDQSRGELRASEEAFCRKTGWAPAMSRHVAGALRYADYNFFKRWMVRSIADKQGRDTDASRDHEYTDWDDLTRFVEMFLAMTPLQEGRH